MLLGSCWQWVGVTGVDTSVLLRVEEDKSDVVFTGEVMVEVVLVTVFLF